MPKFTIAKIYLDMDGVLSDFTKRYQEISGSTPERDDKSERFGQFFDKFIEEEQIGRAHV